MDYKLWTMDCGVWMSEWTMHSTSSVYAPYTPFRRNVA